MTPAARSVNVFGTYLLLLGALLLIAPNLLMQAVQLPPTTEVWVRIVGMLEAILGIYYRIAASTNLAPFFLATVLVRSSLPVFFLGFILAGWVEWPIMLLGAIEAAGALWTWKALRHSAAGV
jgi:hypothetical protein